MVNTGFACSSVGEETACSVGDQVSIPGSGRSHGEGNENPFQYSCLENAMDRGALHATVHGITRVGHIHAFLQYYGKSLGQWFSQGVGKLYF